MQQRSSGKERKRWASQSLSRAKFARCAVVLSTVVTTIWQRPALCWSGSKEEDLIALRPSFPCNTDDILRQAGEHNPERRLLYYRAARRNTGESLQWRR